MRRTIMHKYNRIFWNYRLPKASSPNIVRDDKRAPFFVHIHLPKTGGSTFNTILKQNFNDRFEQFAGRFIYLLDKFSNEQIIRFMNLHTKIDCIASHNFSAILPYQSAPKKIIAIAFVRNPVDTFFSLYFHLRFRGGGFDQAELSVEEYVDSYVWNTNRKITGFLKMLTGCETERSFNYIKRLVQNGHLYIFDTYDMKGACNFLQKKFPNYFEDIHYVIENISTKDQEVAESLKEKISKKVSEYDWKLLELAKTTLLHD